MATSSTNDTIGGRLRFLRERVGLTAIELARLAGLRSKSHVRVIEASPEADLTGTTLFSLADVLGCDARWLARGEGRPPAVKRSRAAVKMARQRLQASAPPSPGSSGGEVKATGT